METDIDDADLLPGRVTPAQWVGALAYPPARAGAEAAAGSGPETVRAYTVLGADTVCVKGSEIIGQPADAADARRILRLLEGGEHEVITGIALVSSPPGRAHRQLWSDRARVRVGPLGRDRIEEYVASGQWRGKAGAYNLAERLDAGWPINYEGDPTTIMGLPVRLLTRLLTLPADLPVATPAAAPPLTPSR